MTGSNYITTLITTGALLYWFIPGSEVKKEIPHPAMTSEKLDKRSVRNNSLTTNSRTKRDIQSQDSAPEINDIEERELTLFERVTRLDDINKAKEFVLNFEAPQGEEFERQRLEDGSIYIRYDLDDGTIIARKFRPDGSNSVVDFISEKLRIVRVENNSKQLSSFGYENMESGEYISVNYSDAGKIKHRTQRMKGLWFQQSFDEKGKATRQDVIDDDTYEKVSFDYFFRNK